MIIIFRFSNNINETIQTALNLLINNLNRLNWFRNHFKMQKKLYDRTLKIKLEEGIKIKGKNLHNRW